MHSEVYKNEGGQVLATATTTLSDGGTVTDCTTFYIEGPAGGIPNLLITSQLEQSTQSYQSSSSYPPGGTPALMAQVAVKESNYVQFLEPPQPPKNVDLYNLYASSNNAIAAKWPLEGKLNSGLSDGGSHIGLTQVMTDPNQTPDPNAWNWITNASDGVNLFSGTPPTEYQDTENKIQHAADLENEMIQEYIPGAPPSFQLPQLSATQLENMALVLYGPSAHLRDLTLQYYVPVCSSGLFYYIQLTNYWVCVGGTWSWSKNSTGNPQGVAYADAVTAETVPR
jgi:hypothetical protein